jgi:hypothetical protein
VIEWLRSPHLELRVLHAAEGNPTFSFNLFRWNEPAASITNYGEQIVSALGVEGLHQAGPTSIPTGRGERDGVVTGVLVRTARGLHLNPKQLAGEISDEVIVGTVEEREGDAGSDSRQPLDSRRLAQIALLSWVELRHSTNLGLRITPMTPGLQQMRDTIVSRFMHHGIGSAT